MRLRKLLLVFGLCAGVLLLLSALVEAPAAPAADAPESAPIHVRLLPDALPAPEGPADSVARPVTARAVALLALCAALCALPAVSGRRDANGRVLRRRRYVQSVYQVYHQEAASG